MSHRRGSKLQSAVLDLSLLEHQTTPQSHAAVLRTLIKHLLFSRGQLPSLYEQLVQRTERPDPSSRRRPNKGVRRAQQFLAAAEDLFGSVQEGLFALDGPTRCLVLLGASATRPREAYEVRFPAPSGGAAQWSGRGQGCADADAGPLCRFVLRQVVVATPDIPEGTADQKALKLFILVKAHSAAAVPAGFAVKRFTLRMRKGVHVAFNLQGSSAQQQQQQQAAAEQQQCGSGALDASATPPARPGPAAVAAAGVGGAAAAAAAATGGDDIWWQSVAVPKGLKTKAKELSFLGGL